MTIVSQVFDHVIGVDTHAKTHTLVVLDSHGAKLAGDTFPTSPAGLKRAHAWMLRHAPGRILAAVEGTGSYGAQFNDLLAREGIAVAETRPPKRGVRRVGKTDQIDAELAARHALALPIDRVIAPRTHTGDQAALSVLLAARNTISTARTATINQLTAPKTQKHDQNEIKITSEADRWINHYGGLDNRPAGCQRASGRPLLSIMASVLGASAHVCHRGRQLAALLGAGERGTMAGKHGWQ